MALFTFVIIALGIISVKASFNQFISDGVTYWNSTSDFFPIRNSSYGSIELKSGFSMHFDIFFHAKSPELKWTNIFRIGHSGYSLTDFKCSKNDRFPAMWIDADGSSFVFDLSDKTNCFRQYANYRISPNNLYSVHIEYNSSHVYISIDDYVLLDTDRVDTTDMDKLGTKVDIWMSTVTSIAANVTLSNVAILSYDDAPLPSLSPTVIPTHYPTVSPTLSLPTKRPTTFLPTMEMTETYSPTHRLYNTLNVKMSNLSTTNANAPSTTTDEVIIIKNDSVVSVLYASNIEKEHNMSFELVFYILTGCAMGGILFCLCACCCFGWIVNKKIKNLNDNEHRLHDLDKNHRLRKCSNSDSELISISDMQIETMSNQQSVVGGTDGTTIITTMSSSNGSFSSPSSEDTQMISVQLQEPSAANPRKLHYMYSTDSSSNNHNFGHGTHTLCNSQSSDTNERMLRTRLKQKKIDLLSSDSSADTMKVKRSHDPSMDTCIYHDTTTKETSGLCIEESKDNGSSNLHVPGTDEYASSEYYEGRKLSATKSNALTHLTVGTSQFSMFAVKHKSSSANTLCPELKESESVSHQTDDPLHLHHHQKAYKIQIDYAKNISSTSQTPKGEDDDDDEATQSLIDGDQIAVDSVNAINEMIEYYDEQQLEIQNDSAEIDQSELKEQSLDDEYDDDYQFLLNAQKTPTNSVSGLKLPKSHKKVVNVDNMQNDHCNAKNFLSLPQNGSESGMSSASSHSNASNSSYESTNATDVSSLVSSSCTSVSSISSDATGGNERYLSSKFGRKVVKLCNNRRGHFKINIEDIMEDDCDIDDFQESLISAKTLTLNTMDSESTAYYSNSPGPEMIEEETEESETESYVD